MEGLRTYLYISKSKTDVLYDQLVDQETTTTKDIGIDIKVLKAGLKSEVAKRDTVISRLNTVVTYIRGNCHIGSVDEPSEYFEGSCRLKFGAMPNEMVIWGNTLGETILGLSGSSWHLIGVKPVEHTGYGGTFAPIVYGHLEAAAGGRSDPAHPPPDSSLNKQMISDLIGNGLSRILEDFRIEQNVEFLARRFDRFPFQEKWILIGSPLYVALAE